MKYLPEDYPDRIRWLRAKLGLSQKRLAELLGVSFASVNRWENGQARPNRLAWSQILRLGIDGPERLRKPPLTDTGAGIQAAGAFRVAEDKAAYWLSDELPEPHLPGNTDFTAPPEIVRLAVEVERLTYGHLFSPAFATETSLIDPLPHQRIAVYDHMLPQPRLRFLLADDAGAGKTIMAGLYIREMLTRRLIRRVLIVPPAGLVGNWQRELRTLFSLPFKIVTGTDSRSGNPFTGPGSDLVIVSVDTLCGAPTFARLGDPDVEPYDLAVFDEAHKLSADRNPDFTVRKTDRYRLAEAIAGAADDPDWMLPWRCHHLLLLTATPHMGKDFPYFCLWRLLEPEALATMDAFNAYPPEARRRHFIRRTKEEMVRFDGTPIYPKRESHTLSYDLGPAEQCLYDETTAYIRTYYNRARILNRAAARLAMSIFQRRLASSTYALLRSLERRLEKLDRLIEDIQSGQLTEEQLTAFQHKIEKTPDVFDRLTADEEEPQDGREQNEVAEDQLLTGGVATSLAELLAERLQVEDLLDLARQVLASGEEAKFEKLREVLQDERFREEKILIFTEHRDTLDFLVRRLEGLGYAGRIAFIHGGMDYQEREAQVEFFKKPVREGGANLMVATDAAGEGINLQFCWLMVNYDIPWNPARLEQRMGRIHRYKQMHDPVLIFNLVAGKTREGKVLKTLLEKLEHIRRELGSEKVFDVIGMQFEGVSLKELILQAVMEEREEEAVQQIEGRLAPEQFKARLEQREKLLGTGGDVALQLPEQRAKLECETLRRLLPGYVRRFIEKSAPLLHIGIDGDLEGYFSFKSLQPGALDPFWPVLESYDPARWERLTVYKPAEGEPAIFLHPGEPLFDRYCSLVRGRFTDLARKGGVFVDPYAQCPYFFHLALVRVVRRADPALPAVYGREEPVEVRLVGLRQDETGEIEECPVEHLMLLRGAEGIPPAAIPLVATVTAACAQAKNFLIERVAEPLAAARRQALEDTLAGREEFICRGYAYQEAELALKRARLAERVGAGDAAAKGELTKVKKQQRELADRKERSLAVLRREPELIVPGKIQFLAHALVVPSTDPEDRKRYDREIERIAVRMARGYEEERGFSVQDVSLPELALDAGLEAYPGFDLLSRHPAGEERAIEVKGRASIGDIELSENEWARACNLRHRYWLYVVYDCASAHPRLLRVQDPFGKMLARRKGGVVIGEQEIFAAAEK
ncbi:SNF2-related [Moorella glycerini]|uniref:RNA polymerase-associated protein RapA n=1 Tax=Neomoorella stamsii TaxID=1266720 RepID=A0A9X7J3Y0_9FIRM|nr:MULTISPECIES: helicase-related protein [Moorella]PRR74602.1 RNA polymerase-associated protein RapA [Moorella stamsii]CEP69111.1 SNF2-related [Moorella glycerini]